MTIVLNGKESGEEGMAVTGTIIYSCRLFKQPFFRNPLIEVYGELLEGRQVLVPIPGQFDRKHFFGGPFGFLYLYIKFHALAPASYKWRYAVPRAIKKGSDCFLRVSFKKPLLTRSVTFATL